MRNMSISSKEHIQITCDIFRKSHIYVYDAAMNLVVMNKVLYMGIIFPT